MSNADLSVGVHEAFNSLYDFRHGRPVLMLVCPHALYEVYNLRTPLFAQSGDRRSIGHATLNTATKQI